MRRFFVDKESIFGDKAVLLGVQRNHLVNVLRLRVDDEVILTCGDGLDYYSKITDISKKEVNLDIFKTNKNIAEPKTRVTLLQGVSKGEKMDLITQKITELGAYALTPFSSDFTVKKADRVNLERLRKISREATKQCRRSNPVIINNPEKLKNIVENLIDFDLVILAYENENKITLKDLDLKNCKLLNIGIIVGSEGGFSEKEIELIKKNGVKIITLGKRILRAETAAITLTSLIMYELGEFL